MTNEELCLLIQHGDNKKSYLEMLYQKNKGLIFKMANRYKELSDFDDLCQEGYLGLVEASEQWKEGEAKFSTYAIYWIKSYMIRYMENYNNVVRLPSFMLSNIQKLKALTDNYYMNLARKPTIKELSHDMKLSETKIEKIIEGALFLNMKSTAEPLSEYDSTTIEDTIRDDRNRIDEADEAIQREQLRAVIWGIVDSLDEEEARVIHEKYENKLDGKSIADRMGLTPAKIHNMEAHAMREMRKSHNRKRLLPFFEQNSRLFSISLGCSSYGYFSRTWTSSPETAVLIAERRV